MGFPTKVQLIKRPASEQWYINFPSAVAQAMEFEKGETVEWIISDKAHLILARSSPPPDPVAVQKKRPAQPQSQTPALPKRLRPGSHSDSRFRSAPDTSSLGLTALPGPSHPQQRHLHQRRTASGLECRLSALLKKPRRAGATLCPCDCSHRGAPPPR